MCVYNKVVIWLIVFSVFIGGVFAFNVCNAEVNEPWVVVNDSNGLGVFIVDNDGDFYFEGINHDNLATKNSYESFEVNNNFFNEVTSFFVNVTEGVGVIPSRTGLIVRDSSGDDVFLMESNGNITSVGAGIYNGSQAECSRDGLYCDDDQNYKIWDYWCEMSGTKTGSCKGEVVGTGVCNSQNHDFCTNFSSWFDATYDCFGDECRETINPLGTCLYWAESASYGSCTKSCGTGVKYKTITCASHDSNMTFTEQDCIDLLGPKPVVWAYCNTQACCTNTKVWYGCYYNTHNNDPCPGSTVNCDCSGPCGSRTSPQACIDDGYYIWKCI